MNKRILLLVGFFSVTPVILLVLILFSLYLVHENSNDYGKTLGMLKKSVDFKALPENSQETLISLSEQDVRIDTLESFLEKYKSPLFPYSKLIVETADRYGLDYRLLPSIAMQESNLCKKIPKDSYNCWGFGIYGSKVTRFSGYEEAIETVSKTLAKKYLEQGYETPEEIMKKYTPSSNGSWAEGVLFFMDKLEINPS